MKRLAQYGRVFFFEEPILSAEHKAPSVAERDAAEPNVRVGVAMITSAPDAISLHEEAINEMWSRALKGQAAANHLRELVATAEKSQPTSG